MKTIQGHHRLDTTHRLHHTVCAARALLLLTLLGTASLRAATLSWSGASATTGNWSDTANWGYSGPPANGDTLIFPAFQPRLSNTNNIASLVLAQIRFAGAGGGYDIRGNAFTLNNGIQATNTAAANTIRNNITLATADATVNVDSGTRLTLYGVMGGSVGLTKTGAGTLNYSGNNNSYSGTTRVNEGTLELNCGALNGAFGGSLVIGDGVGAAASAVVKLILSYEIPAVPITIESDGRLDLNSQPEIIGTSLTMNDGEIVTGSSSLWLATNATITVSSTPTISGYLNIGGGTCTIQGGGTLYLYAGVSGTANIVKNETCSVRLYGTNTFTGTLTANTGGYVYALTDLALGTTNGGTIINNAAFLAIGSGVNITNEALTMNTTYAYGIDVTSGMNSWRGPVTLSRDTMVYVSASDALDIIGPISGAGGITKWGPGTLTLSGATDNTYNGPTVVDEGLLELNKSSFMWAIGGGSLTVGDGVGGANVDIVRYTGTGTSQLNSSVPITLYGSGLLDLNGNTDGVGPLTFYGGDVTTGAGQIQVYGLTAGLSTNTSSSISGNLHLPGSSTTIDVADSAAYEPDLNVSAVVTGGEIIKTGAGTLYFSGNNSYSGLTQVRAGTLKVDNDGALGSSGGGTVVSNGAALHASFSVDNIGEPLTVAGNGPAGNGGLILEGTLSWNTNITLSADTLINCIGAGNNATNNGAISGPGGFTKIGENPLCLTGPNANTYNGTTYVLEGRLDLNKSSGSAIPYPHLLVIGGTTNSAEVRELRDYQTDNVRVDRTGLLNLNGFFDYLGDLELLNGGDVQTGAGTAGIPDGYTLTVANPLSVGSSEINGHLALSGAARTWLVTNNGTLYVNAAVTGDGAITKSGPDNMYLMSSNAYTGLTVVQDGFLWAENAWALGTTNNGTVVSNAASLVLRGSFGITNEALTLNGVGQDSGWGALDAETSGTNFWTGPITLNADSTIAPYGSGTHLRLSGAISGTGGLSVRPGSGKLYLDGSTANTYGGTTRVDSGKMLVLNKSVADGAIPRDLLIDGTVRLARFSQVADSADVLVNNGGLFDFDINYDYFDTLRGLGTVNFGDGGWLNLGGYNGSSTFNGIMTGIGFAPGYTLRKTGLGTFTMNGNNSYTSGRTDAYGGRLVINGSQPQSVVQVWSSGSLGGTGIVGPIYVQGDLGPGTSPGCLTSSNLTFTASGSFLVELNGTTPCSGYDRMIVLGTNNLANATLNVTTAFATPPGIGSTFRIIDNDGTDAITGTFAGLPNGATFDVGGTGFKINYNGGTGNDVELTLLNRPGASVTINAADRGWYRSDGDHTPSNDNYLTGEEIPTTTDTNEYRSWFVFDVPAFSGGDIVKAELLINCYSNASPTRQETYVLRHVSTPIGTLTAGGSGLTNIFKDLADGTVYSLRNVAELESGERAIIPLNASFINDATAATGGQLALGGSISTLDPVYRNERLFAFSFGSNPADVQLRLTFGTSMLINATTNGWYDNTGYHNATNANYFAGENNGKTYRDFFVFSLPGMAGRPMGAELLAKPYNVNSPSDWVSYQLRDVTTPIATLVDNASGATGIFADLANGDGYGGRDVYVNERYLGVNSSIPLNGAFTGAAYANRGGQIALGGSLTLDPTADNEGLFGSSPFYSVPGDVQLWLGFIPTAVPAPFFVTGSPTALGGNVYQFVLSGTTGTTNEIQASMDFENWDVARTLYMTNTTTTFYHTNSAFPYRYFRARLLQ